MADLICPVCGDKVVAGKCTFCGYVLTSENDNSYEGINNCKDHVDHSINVPRPETDNESVKLGETVNINLMNSNVTSSGYATNGYSSGTYADKQLNTLFYVSVILLIIAPFISFIVCIIAMQKAGDESTKKRFRTIMIVDIVLFSLSFVFTFIFPFIIGLISVFAGM